MSEAERSQQRWRQHYGSISSGQEGDISDVSMDSGSSIEEGHQMGDVASKVQFALESPATWRDRRRDKHFNNSARLGLQTDEREAELSEYEARNVLMENRGLDLDKGETYMLGASHVVSPKKLRKLDTSFTHAPLEAAIYPGSRSTESAPGVTKMHFRDKDGSVDGGESPRSPLGGGQRKVDQLERASHFSASNQSPPFVPAEASRNSILDAVFESEEKEWFQNSAESRIGNPIPSSGEESSSKQRESRGWQASASPKTRSRRERHSPTSIGVDLEEQKDEISYLQKSLAAAEASARRWKAAAAAADSQAQGFQVALAATEQTMQALNNRHVGEFAAAWERIRDMERRMTETVHEHAAQVSSIQAELAAKQREVDTNREIESRDRKLMEETNGRLRSETWALEDALAKARSELDHMRAVGNENGVNQTRLEQLEREITEAKSREAKKEEEMLAKVAEAAEAIEDTKQQAREALQQAESRWQDILAKRDAKRVGELQAKEVERQELLEVAEERLREIAVLQQEVSDLQGGVSEMEWMRERMAGFEREVILAVSNLSRALEEKEEVIEGLQTALKSARDALVEAEANLRREEKHNRGTAAAKARDFAAELSKVEDLYRLELQRKEGQMRSLEAELQAARDETAEQAEVAERIQGELAKERERNEERMARVASEIEELRARVAGAESAGKIAAALRSELEECCLECDALRERYTNQQLEDVELGQQVVTLQRQLEADRFECASLEADLRNSIRSVETELRQAQTQKQGLETELGGLIEELGGGEGPVNVVAAVRTLRERADESRGALADALSQVELLKRMEEQVAAKSERMKELRRALSDAKEALGELQMKREAEGQGLAGQISKVLEQARQEREAWAEAQRENAERIEELKNCEDRAKRALGECEQELRAEQALRKGAEERNAEVGAELHRVVSTVEQKDEELDKLGSQVSDLQRRVEEEKQKKVAAQTVIEGLKGQVLNLESQLATSEAQTQEEAEKVVSLEGQLREKSEGLSKLADSLKVLEGQSAEKRAAVDLVEALRNDLTEVTTELERAKEQLEGREGELRTALHERDEKEEEAVRITQELSTEREKGEKQSDDMKRHVEAAAEEYQRARAAVKAELDWVNGVLEQECLAASLALRDAKQSQHDAEDRCESLERELRTVEQTLNLRTSEVVQMREAAVRAERETSQTRQRAGRLDEEADLLREEVRGYKEEVRETVAEVEKLRKVVKSREKAITGLEEKLQLAKLESATSEKQAVAFSKETEREKRGKKELVRKVELLAAAAEKSAQGKEKAEKSLAEVGKKLERAQKSKGQLEKELERSKKERQTLTATLRDAEAALEPLRTHLQLAEQRLATCQSEAEAKARGLDARLAASDRERLEVFQAQSVAEGEKEEALGGLQEALRVVDAAVAQKGQAVKELEEARRGVGEARERALEATREAERAAAEKQEAVDEKKAIIEAMEGVLASIEQERTDLFAMAKAAAMELAREMKKVKHLQSGLHHLPPLEQPCLGPPLPEAWPKGFLVKEYLASDLAVATRAAEFAGPEWLSEKHCLLTKGETEEPRNVGKAEREKMDQGTNTDSIVVDRSGLAQIAGNAMIGSKGETSLVHIRTNVPVLNTESEIFQQVEVLQKQVAVKEQELESVQTGYADRVALFESELAAGRRALESVQQQNKQLKAENEAHVLRAHQLSKEILQTRQALASESLQLESTHSAERAKLQEELRSIQQRLHSAMQELGLERLRAQGLAESAAGLSQQVSSLSGKLRAFDEERSASKTEGRILQKGEVNLVTVSNGLKLKSDGEGREAVYIEEIFFLTGHVRALTESGNTGKSAVKDASVGTASKLKDRGSSVREGLVQGSGEETGVRSEVCCQKDLSESLSNKGLRCQALEATVDSLKEELEQREKDVARLQKESRRVFRLVEEKEEEAEELQKKLETSQREARALLEGRVRAEPTSKVPNNSVVGPETEGWQTEGPEEPRTSPADARQIVGDSVSADVSEFTRHAEGALRAELGSARAEVLRLSEILRVCAQEREAAEEELRKAFAEDLRTAAEKYESVREEFLGRMEKLEMDAEARGKDVREREREEFEKRRREEVRGLKERMKDRENELLTMGKQFRDAMQLANQMREAAENAERSRQEVCAELERAVGRMRDQQEVLEVLQQRLQAAGPSRAFVEEQPLSFGVTEESLEKGAGSGKGEGLDDEQEGGDAVDRRVAALDQVIEMWREACRQKDVEISTLRSALTTTQALLADAEERLGQLRTDFQRLDLANEDTCSELDRRIAEMTIAAKHLTNALQAADHPTVEIRTAAELAHEGQLAQVAMAAAAVIGMGARDVKRMVEHVEILQRMQATPDSAEVGAGPSSSERFVRTPARKPAWLDQENGPVHSLRRASVERLRVVRKVVNDQDQRALSPIQV